MLLCHELPPNEYMCDEFKTSSLPGSASNILEPTTPSTIYFLMLNVIRLRNNIFMQLSIFSYTWKCSQNFGTSLIAIYFLMLNVIKLHVYAINAVLAKFCSLESQCNLAIYLFMYNVISRLRNKFIRQSIFGSNWKFSWHFGAYDSEFNLSSDEQECDQATQ